MRIQHRLISPSKLAIASSTSFRTVTTVEGLQRIRSAAPVPEIFDVPIRFIEACVSQGIWYDKPDGCRFNVGYIDTGLRGANFRKQTPGGLSSNDFTIVALPGYRATHSVFTPLFKRLHHQLNGEGQLKQVDEASSRSRVRCIAVNLPGSEYCLPFSSEDSRFFTEKPFERAALLNKVLNDIGVARADLCVAESDACATALQFAAIRNDVRGVVLLSPAFHPFYTDSVRSSRHQGGADDAARPVLANSNMLLNPFVNYVEKKNSLFRRAVFQIGRRALFRKATSRWPLETSPDFEIFRAFARLIHEEDIVRVGLLRTLLLRSTGTPASSKVLPHSERKSEKNGTVLDPSRFAMLLAYCKLDRFVEASHYELIASALDQIERESKSKSRILGVSSSPQFLRTLKFSRLEDLQDPHNHRLLRSPSATDRIAESISDLVQSFARTS